MQVRKEKKAEKVLILVLRSNRKEVVKVAALIQDRKRREAGKEVALLLLRKLKVGQEAETVSSLQLMKPKLRCQ